MATTRYVNCLERFTYIGETPGGRLADAWPAIREGAEAQGLASTWLLFQHGGNPEPSSQKPPAAGHFGRPGPAGPR